MENTAIYVLLIIVSVGLIAFVIWKNQRDKKAFEQELNEDYRKTKDEEGDAESEPDRGSKI